MTFLGADPVRSLVLPAATAREAKRSPKGRCLEGYTSGDDGLTAAVVIGHRSCPCWHGERLDPAEMLIAARRLAGARPHLAAVAGIVHPEDLWRLCRDGLTGVDVRIDGWDIRGRWFGVVIGATPQLGELRCGETIPWRVIAAQMAPRERHGPR